MYVVGKLNKKCQILTFPCFRMVRQYKRKTSRAQTPPDLVLKGINDVISYGRSIRAVASDLNMKVTTLWRYVKQAKAVGDIDSLSIGYAIPSVVFNKTQEESLAKYLTTAANIYFGLSPKDVRILAYECASAFQITMPESWVKNKCAGPDWFASFM